MDVLTLSLLYRQYPDIAVFSDSKYRVYRVCGACAIDDLNDGYEFEVFIDCPAGPVERDTDECMWCTRKIREYTTEELCPTPPTG